jgi:hypothetical protein
MTEGAMLSGRVVRDGKPLPNVSVALTASDRSPMTSAGHFTVGTDADGRFLFVNLPPGVGYYISSVMETVGPHGTIPIRWLRLGGDGETRNLGDLLVGPAFRLQGRVILDDEKKIPAHTRLLIGRGDVADYRSVELGADGEFDVTGIPGEPITLSVRVPGYRISPKNDSGDFGNLRLHGLVARDTIGIECLLEKTDARSGGPGSPLRGPKHPNLDQRPLRGVETREP